MMSGIKQLFAFISFQKCKLNRLIFQIVLAFICTIRFTELSKMFKLLFGLINIFTEIIHKQIVFFSKICSSHCLIVVNDFTYVRDWHIFTALIFNTSLQFLILWKFVLLSFVFTYSSIVTNVAKIVWLFQNFVAICATNKNLPNIALSKLLFNCVILPKCYCFRSQMKNI